MANLGKLGQRQLADTGAAIDQNIPVHQESRRPQMAATDATAATEDP
jgi:hypothetical protein